MAREIRARAVNRGFYQNYLKKAEEFFQTNDSATIAVEVPVYLTREESEFPKSLAGHTDIIQVRNNKIHILDYKPYPKSGC